MSDSSKMIEVTDIVEVKEHSDCGKIYVIVCPECGDKVEVCKSAWWDQHCSCGMHWSMEIKAVGEIL
jgi:hypothetical protein